MANAAGRSTKRERQNAAREHARQLREQELRKARQRRVITWSSVAVVVVAIAAVIIVVVAQSAPAAPSAGPKNMLSDGIVLTGTTSYQPTRSIPADGKPVPTKQADDGKAHITIYEDLQCPICRGFEQTNDAQMARWLDAGTATVEIHPVSILDRLSSGNQYSTRAANAMGCVAQYDPKRFWAVNKAFYNAQPEEGGHGRTDQQLIATMKQAGAHSTALTRCVTSQRFTGWVQSATDRITPVGTRIPNSNATVPDTGFGTPTIIVNGNAYTPPTSSTLGYSDPTAFTDFVRSVAPGVDG